MAIGATTRDVVKLVFAQGMIPLAIGLTVGLAASLAVNQLLSSLLIQVSPADPVTLIAASAILMLSATARLPDPRTARHARRSGRRVETRLAGNLERVSHVFVTARAASSGVCPRSRATM